jgi:hypothetical protein
MRVRTSGIDQQLRDLTERVRQLRREIGEMISQRYPRAEWRRPMPRRGPDTALARRSSLAKELGPKRRLR